MSDALHLFYDDRFLLHDAGLGHPERPARLEAIVERLRDDPVPGASWREPEPASRETLLRVHGPRYLERLDGLRGRTAALDLDTA
ncbi:MAG: histone deacetylase, partial [Planctomycetota bacterium]